MFAARPGFAFEASPILEVKRLSLGYDTDAGYLPAVDNISFELAPGDRLVLLGPSGCGKSSILKAVAGFLPAASGSILVHGHPISGPGPDRVVVFQEFDQLLPWKTVIENVVFPLRIANKLSKDEAALKARSILGKVGLGSFLDAYPHTLSGGMKQRAAIARALAVEPDILLMDEPFAALDALTRGKLQEDLLAIVSELQITLLFVTHAIDEAILIGTQLRLLSSRPARTLATLDTQNIDLGKRGSPEFERLAREVHSLLFDRADNVHV